MSKIRSIIEALGFSHSNSLYYNSDDLADTFKCNYSTYKIIKELNPIAFYCVNRMPFIVFFESSEKQVPAALIKRVWNAQIPIMIICFENRIEIYNGCSIDEKNKLILLEKLDLDQLAEASLFSYWNISSASFWTRYEKKLTAPKLDTIMLDNIKDATNHLKKAECAPFAVRLVLRLIFIRYLIDRGVDLNYKKICGNVNQSQQCLLNIMESKDDLYDLFSHLKSQFNGNLFEMYQKEGETEAALLDDLSLKTLYDLMAGNLVLSSGQLSLFPLYDFNIIPVELISSIYERFLGDEKQQKDKAFYTPPYLVDYLLHQTVSPFMEKNNQCRILDPACGSGIFLVESARKLIETNILQNSSDISDNKLINIVVDNLWGIDKNPEAIDVAAFSIYLTLLDYKDPKTLKNFKLPMLKDRNLFACDFFSEEVDNIFSGKHFDFIIGNPPWGKVGGSHIEYCQQRNLPVQNEEISRSFILRTKDFTDEDTCCCLIVTSKLFYNMKSPAVNFRHWLLEKTKVDKYIELAAVRELIFTKARGSAGVIIYRFTDNNEQSQKNEMCHLTLKPNIFFKLFNIIVIEKNDYKYIRQTLLLENDWAWKTLVFGHTHDFYTIKHLRNKYPSVMQVIKKQKFPYGTGIRVADGDKQDARHLIGRWLIDAEKGIKAFDVIKQYGHIFQKVKIHRAKADKQHLFSSPYALIKKGFDTQTYKFRAAYSEEDFIYTDAITGICGKNEDKQALLSFVGLFNSSFYSYLNLMLGSSSGIEREQGFPTEIFKYPAIIDEQIAELVERIQEELKIEREDFFSKSSKSESIMQELDLLILDKYGLSKDLFVDYALNVQIPLLACNKLTWKKTTSQQLRDYASIFANYFSTIFKNNEKHVFIKIYTNVAYHYCAVEFEFQSERPIEQVIELEGDQNSQLKLISKFMLNEVNDLFYQMKDVISFSESSFFILKTDEYRNWHPAMAKLDLADVLDSILSRNEVDQ